jgi:hypothetical protein
MCSVSGFLYVTVKRFLSGMIFTPSLMKIRQMIQTFLNGTDSAHTALPFLLK